jgi:Family of unknown function (DUF6328)
MTTARDRTESDQDDRETPKDPATSESGKERVDRELIELLQGLRVALPGVQVLFAFLLTLPFATGFKQVDEFEQHLFFLSLVTAAVASICFITPAAQHRVLFRTGSKEILVRRSNRYGIAGALGLGVAMASAVILVVDVIYARAAAVWTAVGLVALWAWCWFVQPLFTRRQAEEIE